VSSDGERIPRDEGGYEGKHEGKNDQDHGRGSTIMELVISICFLVPKAAAQSDKYSKMAPVDQYLMERNAEILLARSAAPDSISALKAAFANKQLPDLESGNMVFMMSKSAYLYDAGDHNGPHVMFFTALNDGKDWGAGASGSPVFAGPYWFLSSKEPSQAKGLPPILVFAVEVAKWSDGTAAPMHQE
jgi:hypothetical protein